MFGQRNNDDDNNQVETDQSWQHPGNPIDSDQPTPASDSTTLVHSDGLTPIDPSISAPAPDPTASSDSPAPAHDESTHPTKTDDAKDELVDVSSHDLIEIKQKALGELSPLMQHLEQNPEEKFRTIMMMIQASDDQTQIKTAYEAAKAIKDDKVRAQALLDIVNEINYFTTQHNS